MGALHQQLQQLILRLNQQPVKSDRQLQGTLSNNTLTAELHEESINDLPKSTYPTTNSIGSYNILLIDEIQLDSDAEKLVRG
ncbi:unnamed protein product [Rotaria magnacalcarata]|uniref:Uncharacterized protein n=1 Tax=Rotaria magnacalcarata TaxID=392030 RepID=A0A8S2N225_9BILA|nr:unnamed protein product [Rotaria magnacalcarata]CAF4958284.1 unnamed protein product [Rotaria magnacalcarata]CAF5191636.1 unnamed protein product [Rotaria magnacalcarata]